MGIFDYLFDFVDFIYLIFACENTLAAMANRVQVDVVVLTYFLKYLRSYKEGGCPSKCVFLCVCMFSAYFLSKESDIQL